MALDPQNLWVLHGKRYDLREFAAKHPGGSRALEITRGRDATEMFEMCASPLPPRAQKIKSKEARTAVAAWSARPPPLLPLVIRSARSVTGTTPCPIAPSK